MKQKLLSFFLVFALLISFAGCKNSNTSSALTKTEKTEEGTKKAGLINLLYTKSDSFNPYTAATENNRNLCKLIYEPLIKADNEFKPSLRLANSVNLTEKDCTVTLKRTVFSDGSPVTANDVIYSYNTAKANAFYSARLYEVSGVSSVSADTVVFSLTRRDPYFENLLDFPILKSGSDKITDSDGVSVPPVGAGRYILNKDDAKLVLNENFFGNKGEIKEINLINAPDDDSLSHYIEVGASELYYTVSDSGKIVRMSGKKVNVNLNTMMYIGINLNSAGLSDRRLRYAISSAIDRKAVCKDVYFGNATPARGYFNASIEEVKAVQSAKPVADTQITVENLNKIGYNSKDNEGYFVNSAGKRIVLRLLVDSENRLRDVAAKQIASQLKSAGIEIKLIETSYADFLNCLKSNSFDLYLGEVSVLPNFDMSPLVTSGGSMSFGTSLLPVKDENKDNNSQEGESKDGQQGTEKSEPPKPIETEEQRNINTVLGGYYEGKNSLSDVAGTLLTEMLQIPVLYKKGLFFYKDNIVSGVISSESDIYYSIENYKLSE